MSASERAARIRELNADLEALKRGEEPPSDKKKQTAEARRAPSEKIDLDDLARQVLPLVKQILAVEGERSLGGWG